MTNTKTKSKAKTKRKIDIRKVKFDPMEMSVIEVNPHWSEDELLEKDGLFLLGPVCKKLGVDIALVRKKFKDKKAEGEDTWETIGISKVLSVWFVRMDRFAPYYRNEKYFKIQKVNPAWDGNELMVQSGLYFLTDVCEKIPFTPHQFRHQVRNNPNAEKELGVWWDEELKHYIVRMEKFSKYIKELWLKNPYGFDH